MPAKKKTANSTRHMLTKCLLVYEVRKRHGKNIKIYYVWLQQAVARRKPFSFFCSTIFSTHSTNDFSVNSELSGTNTMNIMTKCSFFFIVVCFDCRWFENVIAHQLTDVIVQFNRCVCSWSPIWQIDCTTTIVRDKKWICFGVYIVNMFSSHAIIL